MSPGHVCLSSVTYLCPVHLLSVCPALPAHAPSLPVSLPLLADVRSLGEAFLCACTRVHACTRAAADVSTFLPLPLSVHLRQHGIMRLSACLLLSLPDRLSPSACLYVSPPPRETGLTIFVQRALPVLPPPSKASRSCDPPFGLSESCRSAPCRKDAPVFVLSSPAASCHLQGRIKSPVCPQLTGSMRC